MIRFTLGLCALLLGACTQAPYTPATNIPAVNLKPVRERIVAIKKGNDTIGVGLTDTRAKLDAAIVAAHQDKLDRDDLNRKLDETSAALEQTYKTQKAQEETIQFAGVDLDRAQEEADTFKLRADAQTARLNDVLPKLANYDAQDKLDHRWWGIGYFLHGSKVLGWHLLIVAAVLAALGFVLNMFFPLLQPFFTAIVKFFISIPGRIFSFIKGLFTKKPPA